MVQVRQLPWLDVVRVDSFQRDMHVARRWMEQFATEGLRLPLKVVFSRQKRCQSSGLLCDLAEQGTVDVVADADAEDARIARPRLNQVQQLGLFRLFSQAVAQDDDVQ